MNISVIIITLNEEESLPRCLKSLPPGCEVIVVDSQSQDRTVEIAKSFGALIYARVFENYSAQKNFAKSKATKKWILSLDADEEVTQTLQEAIVDFLRNDEKTPSQNSAFRLQRRLVFLGRTLRFGKSGDSPIRLFLNDSRFVFEKPIHESIASDGYAPAIPGYLLHHSYKNLSDYFAKFNIYTTKIAEKTDPKNPGLSFVFRPWIEFISRYFLRLGFLDGYPGYVYALVSSLYAFVKYAKRKEIASKRGLN